MDMHVPYVTDEQPPLHIASTITHFNPFCRDNTVCISVRQIDRWSFPCPTIHLLALPGGACPAPSTQGGFVLVMSFLGLPTLLRACVKRYGAENSGTRMATLRRGRTWVVGGWAAAAAAAGGGGVTGLRVRSTNNDAMLCVALAWSACVRTDAQYHHGGQRCCSHQQIKHRLFRTSAAVLSHSHTSTLFLHQAIHDLPTCATPFSPWLSFSHSPPLSRCPSRALRDLPTRAISLTASNV
jgi:hypothetical protein